MKGAFSLELAAFPGRTDTCESSGKKRYEPMQILPGLASPPGDPEYKPVRGANHVIAFASEWRLAFSLNRDLNCGMVAR